MNTEKNMHHVVQVAFSQLQLNTDHDDCRRSSSITTKYQIQSCIYWCHDQNSLN